MLSGLKKNKCIRNIYRSVASFGYRLTLRNKSKAIKKNGYYIVDLMYKISKETNITIWIDDGTLLGYAREKKLLPYDYDIDFAAWIMDNELHLSFLEIMKDYGFERVRCFYEGEKIYTDSFKHGEILVDINFYQKGLNGVFKYEMDIDANHGSVSKYEDEILHVNGLDFYRYDFPDFSLEDGLFKDGCKCLMPRDLEKNVEVIYGTSWKKRIKNYDWKRDTAAEYEGFHPDAEFYKID